MAKKDFKNVVKEELNDIGAITRSMFSEQTLNKGVEDLHEPQPTKRKYTQLATRENKVKTVSLRLTEKDYNELLKKAEESKSGTISNYILQLIRGAK